MLEGVIEDEYGSLGPGDVLAGHHEHGGGVGGDEEGEVSPQLGVDQAVVRSQVRRPRQHRQLRGVTTIAAQ